MAPPPVRILYEDREIRVVHRAAESDVTLITFSDLTFRRPRLDFWGREVVETLSIDAVGVVAKRENWFPQASIEAAAAAVRPVLKPQAVAYGYSMGAYGAVKHGARLGAQAVLSVCPQVSIAPSDTPWDARFHSYHFPAMHRDMRVVAADLAPFTAVIADPYDPIDWGHASHIAALGQVHLVRTPFMGHAAIWLITGSGALGDALVPILAADAVALRAELRRRRGLSGHWFRLMGRSAYRRGNERLAEALWARGQVIGMPGATLAAERADALGERIETLIKRGQRGKAVIACRTLESLAPRAPGLVGRTAHLLLLAGADTESEAAFQRALALRPDGADLHLGLSIALGNQGRIADAVDAARTGHAAAPHESELATHFGHLLNAGSPADRAEAEVVFRAVLARHPSNGRALIGLSNVLAARGELHKAVPLARRAVTRMPGNAGALAWLGRLLLNTGKVERAERLFRRVTRIAPRWADGHVGLADTMRATGRQAEAIAVIDRALARIPGDPALVARKAELAVQSTTTKALGGLMALRPGGGLLLRRVRRWFGR